GGSNDHSADDTSNEYTLSSILCPFCDSSNIWKVSYQIIIFAAKNENELLWSFPLAMVAFCLSVQDRNSIRVGLDLPGSYHLGFPNLEGCK
ncbi:hypothetical protein CEXT_366241, partial [Caerostris extrusa]